MFSSVSEFLINCLSSIAFVVSNPSTLSLVYARGPLLSFLLLCPFLLVNNLFAPFPRKLLPIWGLNVLICHYSLLLIKIDKELSLTLL